MRAGALRHRVQVDENVRTQNSTGEFVDGWVTRATVWASIEPQASAGGGEVQLLGGLKLTAVANRITMRWCPKIAGLTNTWRLRFQTTIYDIISVEDVEMKHQTFITLCSAGKNRG